MEDKSQENEIEITMEGGDCSGGDCGCKKPARSARWKWGLFTLLMIIGAALATTSVLARDGSKRADKGGESCSYSVIKAGGSCCPSSNKAEAAVKSEGAAYGATAAKAACSSESKATCATKAARGSENKAAGAACGSEGKAVAKTAGAACCSSKSVATCPVTGKTTPGGSKETAVADTTEAGGDQAV